MRAGDATLHLGWTLHAAPPNRSGKPRPALAVTYFVDGARVHPQLLRYEGIGSGGNGPDSVRAAGAADLKAVRLTTYGGSMLVVRLLADDAATWTRWLAARPPVLIPGTPVKDDELTPVLFDAAAHAGAAEAAAKAAKDAARAASRAAARATAGASVATGASTAAAGKAEEADDDEEEEADL